LESTRYEAEKAKILLIDDNQSNVLLLEKMLRMYRFQNIMTLTDSRKAYDLIQTFKPDLVLLDLQMPYIDGFTILEWIRNKYADSMLPVIVITAQSDKENKLKALSLGASDLVGKPFDHMEVLTRIGNLLQIKLLHNQLQEYNLQLEQKIQERTKEIKNLQAEVIDRLMRATEFRDETTGNHIVRIGRYTYILARKLGVDEEESAQMSMASKMHDLGKVGIPDKILLKREKLSNEEMELMKSHSAKGAQILVGSKYHLLQIAAQIAQTHHEKWDGSGYPEGLKGKEIPLVGRIVALADVFDALITARPYKNAWPFDEVLRYINEQSGSHFDPMVVDAFLNSIEPIKAIVKNSTMEKL